MKSKDFILFGAGIVLTIFLASLMSASVTFNPSSSNVAVEQGNSVTITFTVEESGYGNLTDITFNTPITLDSGSDTLVSQDSVVDAIDNLSQGETSGEMSLTFNVPSTKEAGTYEGNLTLTGTYSSEVSYDFPITITVNEPTPQSEDWEDNFCLYDENGYDAVSENPGNDLRLRIEDITVVEGYGEDEKWLPFDEIEIEFNVENSGNEDINNIEVAWGLYDTEQDEWVIEVDDESDFDLRDDDEETLTVTFTLDDKLDVDLEDLDDGDHYVLYARATGEVDDGDDTPTCDAASENIEIVIERDFVIVTNIDAPETVSCGEDFNVNAEVWNIGSKDQDNVEVRVQIKDLDYDQYFEVGDINSFDYENLDLSIPIPEDAEEGNYAISFSVYDEDGDIYENDFDDEESSVPYSFKIEGSCSTTPSGGEASVIVSANLESGGYSGEDLVISAMVTNTGDSEANLLLNVAGYADWADSAKLSRETLVVPAGQSEEVTIIFAVKPDVEGDQLFNLEVVSDNELVASQPISVSIEKSAGVDLGETFGDFWYLWLIGILNVILIVIIIVVAVRIAKKK